MYIYIICQNGGWASVVFQGILGPALDGNRKQVGSIDLLHVQKFNFAFATQTQHVHVNEIRGAQNQIYSPNWRARALQFGRRGVCICQHLHSGPHWRFGLRFCVHSGSKWPWVIENLWTAWEIILEVYTALQANFIPPLTDNLLLGHSDMSNSLDM